MPAAPDPEQPPAEPQSSVPQASAALVKAREVARRRPKTNRHNLTPAMRQVTSADEAAFATLEVELGGRPALLAILAAADLNQDEATTLALLADPQSDGVSLAKLCASTGLGLGRLLKLLQAAALVKGQTKAIAKVAARLPDVAYHLMEDAIPRDVICPVCEGLLTVPGKVTDKDPTPDPIACVFCRGKGTVPFVPDYHVREMALRIGGLLEKNSGSKIVIANQNVGGSAAESGSFDRLMAQLDGALYGDGRARGSAASASGGASEGRRTDTDTEEPLEGDLVE